MQKIATTLTCTLTILLLVGCSGQPEDRWWKGNLHTHTLWSDGDDFPEMVVDWYKKQGYHFLAISDHNILSDHERWVNLEKRSSASEAYAAYVERFGEEWIRKKEKGDSTLVLLKTLEAFRGLFEEQGRFLLIQSEEITDRFDTKPVHVNATNLLEEIKPQGGNSVLEVMQNNVDAVLEQRERTGQLMFPHINHPNFGWGISAEDIMALQGEKFFELYNGHPAVHNYGDSLRPAIELMWDMILSVRLSRGDDVMFGIAVDDAHNYRDFDSNHSNPGRAWVMVKSKELAADALINAMEAGEFYSTTGVILDKIEFSNDRLEIAIRPEEGVSYKTIFIGTRAKIDSPGSLSKNQDDFGVLLSEEEGQTPSYDLVGDEIYVRAKIMSSKAKANPYRAGETEMAWTQPFSPHDQ